MPAKIGSRAASSRAASARLFCVRGLAGGKSQEVFEKDTTVARLVWMFPTRAALVPVFKRFLEMKLDGIDQLTVSALHHHLVTTEIRRRQQFEALRYTIELQPVVLPHAKNAPRRLRVRTVDVLENRIRRIGDAHKAILVLLRSCCALLVLLQLVEREHARAKTQSNQLVPATDRENRSLGLTNKDAEISQD